MIELDSSTLYGFIDYFRSSRTKEFENDLIKGAKAVSGSLGPIPSTPLPDSTSMPSSSVVGSQFDAAARGKTITQSIFGGLSKILSNKELDLSPSEIQGVLTQLK